MNVRGDRRYVFYSFVNGKVVIRIRLSFCPSLTNPSAHLLSTILNTLIPVKSIPICQPLSWTGTTTTT